MKVPPLLPRFVPLSDGCRFVPLEQVIATNLDRLFPGMEILDHVPFRVTRDADFELEDEDEDLLEAIETVLHRRTKFGHTVRLEVDASMSDEVLDVLCRELQIPADAVVSIDGPLDLSGLWDIYALDRPDLKDQPWLPQTSPGLLPAGEESPDLFRLLRSGDILVHHPYDSFATSVEAFVNQASRDPDVLAIKQTIYRTAGTDSAIVRSLVDAARQGKEVVALVELKARFDERSNIERARVLEEAGVHVVYGLVGLKTHAKILLIVRQEVDGIRRYCHVGTGNYNPQTATLYEDLGLLSADPALGADLAELFNHLTGYSRSVRYRRLVVAPENLRPALRDHIRAQAALGARGPDRAQDERAGGLRADRRAVRGVAGRRRHRSHRARHLLPAAPGAGPLGEHPGPVHRGRVPGALAGVPVRRRPGPGRVPDRLGGLHAPQPRPPCRGAGPGRRAAVAGSARRAHHGVPRRRRAGLGAGRQRCVAPRAAPERTQRPGAAPRARRRASPVPDVTVVERELKLAAPPATKLPTLSDPLAGVVAEPAGTRWLLASYFDTDDLRLTRAGASLRHRDDEGWAVKLPVGVARTGRLDRATYGFSGEPGTPPAEALDLVSAWTRRAPVGPVAQLRTTRRAMRLRTTAGVAIGEVVDDDVTVLGEQTTVRGFRELEFELVDEAPAEQVTAIVARLRAAGAGPPDPTPKIVRALAPRASEPPDVNPPGVGPATAGGVVRAALGDALARLVAHDPGIRRGDDPEDLHQARVAARRLRSHLRSFAPLLDVPTDELRGELGWLGDELGRVRDADVLVERLEAEVPDLPVEDRGAAGRLLQRLRTQRAKDREELLVALRSDRYGALLDALVDVARVADMGTRPDDGSDDDRAALLAVVRPAWDSLRSAVAAVSDPPTDDELHGVRRHAKRLRYAAEALEPMFGKPARDFARAVTQIQSVLGEHQDAVVAAHWLRDAATRGPDERAAFVAGELAAAERHPRSRGA